MQTKEFVKKWNMEQLFQSNIATSTNIREIHQITLHTPPLPGAAQRGDIKHSHRHSNGHLPSKVGIQLPDQHRNSGTRTPQYLISNNLSHLSNSKKQIDDRDIDFENDRTSFTCIQIGCSNPVPFIHTGVSKIPELPSITRFRSSRRITQKSPQKHDSFDTSIHRFNETPGLTMKYFGESQNVIGCFTSSRIPIRPQRPQTSFKSDSVRLYTTPRSQ